MEVQVSPAFNRIHTLRERVGVKRQPEEHPYKPVFDGLPSLSGAGRQQPRRAMLHRHLARDHR